MAVSWLVFLFRPLAPLREGDSGDHETIMIRPGKFPLFLLALMALVVVPMGIRLWRAVRQDFSRKAGGAERPPRGAAEAIARFESALGNLRRSTDQEGQPRAREELEALLRDHGATAYKHTTIGALADAALHPHPWQALGAGKPAPEIVGRDIDGHEIKLSDLRGKVVLLSFWGDW
jgi:hypothetical protein